MAMKQRMKIFAVVVLLGASLLTASPVSAAQRHNGFNDEYVFATTKGLNQTDMHPALKVTILPVAVVLDVVFLPFALIAGTVS